MLSSRVPRDFSANPLTLLREEKRRAGRTVLDLTGANPTRAGFPGYAAEAISALADPLASRYDPDPLGHPTAREAVAAYYARRRSGPAGADRIVLTAGTSEAYAHLFRLLCEPGDEVVAPRPSYPLFEPLAKLHDVSIRQYRFAYDGRWQLDLDSVEGAIGPRARALIVVQPNNPTGSSLDEAEIAGVDRICAERGLALISDEVFGDFPWPPRSEPLGSLLGNRQALTFVLGGISKLCGLPQLKLGWIAVSGPEGRARGALQGLEWISDLFLSVGAPVQLALPRILEARGVFQRAAHERIAANLEFLRGLARRGVSLREADGGWSAVVRFRPMVRGSGKGEAPIQDLAEWALDRHDVFLHPGHFYDLPEDDAVVSLLTNSEVLTEALGRLCGVER